MFARIEPALASLHRAFGVAALAGLGWPFALAPWVGPDGLGPFGVPGAPWGLAALAALWAAHGQSTRVGRAALWTPLAATVGTLALAGLGAFSASKVGHFAAALTTASAAGAWVGACVAWSRARSPWALGPVGGGWHVLVGLLAGVLGWALRPGGPWPDVTGVWAGTAAFAALTDPWSGSPRRWWLLEEGGEGAVRLLAPGQRCSVGSEADWHVGASGPLMGEFAVDSTGGLRFAVAAPKGVAWAFGPFRWRLGWKSGSPPELRLAHGSRVQIGDRVVVALADLWTPT